MEPSRKYLDHTADIFFQAEADNLPDLFAQCGLAVEESQIELDKVEAKQKVSFEKEGKKIDLLLFDFLDELLFYKDAEQLIFIDFDIKIEEKEGIYHLTCTAEGEKIDPEKHEQKVDVKAITLHQFEVKKEGDVWKAQVLIDI